MFAVELHSVLNYLEARFNFEPLPHYAMVAIQLLKVTEPLPHFVRGHLEYLSYRFFECDMQGDRELPFGSFKPFTGNRDKASDQWRRAEDCILFLSDQNEAMARQSERLRLVEAVETGRKEGRSLLDIFTDLAVDIDEDRSGLEKKLERRWRSIVEPSCYCDARVPVALLEDGTIAFREVRTRT